MKSSLSLFIVLILFSCANKQEVKREYQILSSIHEGYIAQYGPLFELQQEFDEMLQDKSQGPDMLNAVGKIYHLEDSIYQEAVKLTLEIERLKEKILEHTRIYFEKHDLKERQLFFRLTEEKHFWTNSNVNLRADYQNEISSISKKLKMFRASVLKKVCDFDNIRAEKKMHSFFDPKLNSFEDWKMCVSKLEKATENVAPDNIESFKRFYLDMSYRNIFLDNQVISLQENQSVLSVLAMLTDAQTRLIKGTYSLCYVIRLDIGCGGAYNFDKIFINVDGPEAVMDGDSVELRLFYSFFNSYKNPEIRVDSHSLQELNTETQNGQVHLKFLPKTSQKISGTLTIRNKSGVPKTLPWEKSIKVLKQK